MADERIVGPLARSLTPAEQQARANVGFALEQRIKELMLTAHKSWWALAESLWEFREGGYWNATGADSLEEWLAQPDLALSRTTFFRMTGLWEALVVRHKVPPTDLINLEPSKVREVKPAIMRGEVSPEQGLADAEALGHRDLVEKYRPEQRTQAPNAPLAAEDEPERVQCPSCASWVLAAEHPEFVEGQQ